MSTTQFVFSADANDLVKESKSVANAAKQIERAHIAAGNAANKSIKEQIADAKRLEQAQRRQATELRKQRLDAAGRATSLLPGGLGRAAATRLAGSSLSTGAIGAIGTAATALGGVAIAATAAIAAYKVFTAVLSRNTELQAAQDRAASASVRATANATQELVKNTGALSTADKRQIVEILIPQLQRDLSLPGFDNFARAVGAATSAGGSAPLAVDAARQAAMLYPFDPAAVETTAPQLALIAKALGETNAELAAGIVLKTNEISPIRDIGQLSQALPSIFSAARRLEATQGEFINDAKFAADLFANLASESADVTGDETKTLLRTLIPLINRFFSDREDVGASLQERFDRLTGNADDRAAFLGMSGVPGGSQRDLVEKLFAQGSVLNTNVTNTASQFENLAGAIDAYNKQITELTATTKIAVEQNKLALERENRNRDAGAQARGTIREVMDEVKALGYSDQLSSIGALATNNAIFKSLLDGDSFMYGSSEEMNRITQDAIQRQISALEVGGVTAQEQMNINSLRELSKIANETAQIDRSSRVERTVVESINNIDQLDEFERSLPRATITGGDRYRNELLQRDRSAQRFGEKGTPRTDAYDRRVRAMEESNKNRLRADLPEDPVDRAARLKQAEILDQYRAFRNQQLGLPAQTPADRAGSLNGQQPPARPAERAEKINGQQPARPQISPEREAEIQKQFQEMMLKQLQAAGQSLQEAADANNQAAKNLKEQSKPKPSQAGRSNRNLAGVS